MSRTCLSGVHVEVLEPAFPQRRADAFFREATSHHVSHRAPERGKPQQSPDDSAASPAGHRAAVDEHQRRDPLGMPARDEDTARVGVDASEDPGRGWMQVSLTRDEDE